MEPPRDPPPPLPRPSHPVNFNLGTLHAGDWQSNVPQRCEVGLRLACLPGHTIGETEAAIRVRVAEIVEANTSFREHRPGIRFMGFHATPAIYDLDTDIAHTLRRAHEARHGDPPDESVLTATIDNRYFELDFGIPNCCYGPTEALPTPPTSGSTSEVFAKRRACSR